MKDTKNMNSELSQALEERQLNKAFNLLTEAIIINDKDPQLLYQRCVTLFELKKYQEALEDANACISRDPTHLKAIIKKGAILQKLKRFDEAKQVYEDGMTIYPVNEELLNDYISMGQQNGNLFYIYKMLRDPEIIELLRESPEILTNLLQYPTPIKEMLQKIRVRTEQDTQGNSEPPLALSTEELKIEFELLKEAGNSLYKQALHREAMAEYDKCILLDDTNMIVRNNKAACLIELKQYSEAHELLDDAIEKYYSLPPSKQIEAHLAKLLSRKGRVYEFENNLREAVRYYRDSYQIDPNEQVLKFMEIAEAEFKRREAANAVDIQKSKIYKRKALEFLAAQEWKLAIEQFEKCVTINMDDHEALEGLATCHMQLGNYTMAMIEILRALEREPRKGIYLSRKAMIHYYIKEYDQAAYIWETLLPLDMLRDEATKGLEMMKLKMEAERSERSENASFDINKRLFINKEMEELVNDPLLRMSLEQMMNDQSTIPKYMGDKQLGPKINHLISAGLLRDHK